MIDIKSLDYCQSMMDVNYWGVVRTVRAVLPAMKEQQSGRILNVTSLAGFQGMFNRQGVWVPHMNVVV